MTVTGFNAEEFAKSLAQQAMEVVPAEFDNEKNQFVINTLYKYCVLAGDALIKDESLHLSAEQAAIICQFIGEWTFHKGVDLIKANIPSDYWEQILQKIAFVIFEAAKHSQLTNMNQSESVEYVENEVIKAYAESINELINNGVINQTIDEILSHSNIDEIAEIQSADINLSKNEEEKELKLASLAMFLKNRPREQVNRFIQSLSVEDQQKIYVYISMEDLSQRVDSDIVSSYLSDFNEFLPGVKEKNSRKTSYSALYSTLKKIPVNISDKIFFEERTNIKNFIYRLRNDKIDIMGNEGYSPEVVDTINNYLLSKVGYK
jgi:hypothetical protein